MVWYALQYDGCCDAFLQGADKTVRAKTKAIIYRLKNKGRAAGEPQVRKIKGYDDIFEVKSVGSRHVRGVFFFADSKKEIVFTSFHLKKSGKLPSSVFKQAELVKKAYDNGTQRFTNIH